MEIESSRRSRILYLGLGFGLAGTFVIWAAFVMLRSGLNPSLLAAVFPIAIGIGTVLWLGRPAWIRVDTTELSYVPPLGSPKVFPRSSIRAIVRVAGSRGTTRLELRDQDNRKLVVIEQGFAKNDVERLATFLDARLSWDTDSKQASLAEVLVMMTPEQRAKVMKRLPPEQQNQLEEMTKTETAR